MNTKLNAKMNRILMIVATAILLVSLFAGVVDARNGNLAPVVKPNLENVRDYAAAVADQTYAVDGGLLFAGSPQQGWALVPTPEGIIVSAVAMDRQQPDTLYVGAANELALYRSTDGGANWLRVPLTSDAIGGVTDVAVDSDQRLVYAGTDTAGLFRLRDVGSSMVQGGHFSLAEPVIEVVADSTGAGMVFARTHTALYRAENYGLNWGEVTNLGSAPTALAMAEGELATVYVGTTDRGVVKSNDGLTWTLTNEGLGFVPGSRLQVDALAVDPQQPGVIYVATSYLYGSSELHQSPVGVAMSTDGAQSWGLLHSDRTTAVAGLLPVSGLTGGVYAVSNVSRTPQPLGAAPAAPTTVTGLATDSNNGLSPAGLMAWIVAGLAALALGYALVNDLRRQRLATAGKLAASPVRQS